MIVGHRENCSIRVVFENFEPYITNYEYQHVICDQENKTSLVKFPGFLSINFSRRVVSNVE